MGGGEVLVARALAEEALEDVVADPADELGGPDAGLLYGPGEALRELSIDGVLAPPVALFRAHGHEGVEDARDRGRGAADSAVANLELGLGGEHESFEGGQLRGGALLGEEGLELLGLAVGEEEGVIEGAGAAQALPGPGAGIPEELTGPALDLGEEEALGGQDEEVDLVAGAVVGEEFEVRSGGEELAGRAAEP